VPAPRVVGIPHKVPKLKQTAFRHSDSNLLSLQATIQREGVSCHLEHSINATLQGLMAQQMSVAVLSRQRGDHDDQGKLRTPGCGAEV
jgi:hypothetical protein